jgi:transcriptional regulator with XRE-family HTH domain
MRIRFGARLRAIRQEQGLSLAEACQRAGWCPSYLSEIESSRKKPPKPSRIRVLLEAMRAEAHLSELLDLAADSRTAAIRLIPDQLDAEIARAITELGKALMDGRVTLQTAQQITRLLKEGYPEMA